MTPTARNSSDFALGLAVLALAGAALAWFLTRGDACLDKAEAFVRSAPAVTDRVGRVSSANTSAWLSGQAGTRAGERSFYFLVKGDKGTANAIVQADEASCTCRVVAVNQSAPG